MTTTNSACSWDGGSAHSEQTKGRNPRTHTCPAPPQAWTSSRGWEKRMGKELGQKREAQPSWSCCRAQAGFKVLEQKGLVGTSDLTGCQHSNKIHADLQDALQILSYLIKKNKPYECCGFFSFISPPSPNIKQSVTLGKVNLGFQRFHCFPRKIIIKKRSWQCRAWKLRVTETRGEGAALPKKSLFKGFKRFREWSSIP